MPAVASAQTITGQISGRVTDASGGVLPGVTVTVVNEGTGFKDVRVTDSGGVFTFTNLRVGTYSVMVELEGFRKEQRTGFSLTADSTDAFSTSLQVTGKVYAADYAAPTPSDLTTAVSDMELAFTDAAGRAETEERVWGAD